MRSCDPPFDNGCVVLPFSAAAWRPCTLLALSPAALSVGIEGYGQSTWAQAKAAGIAERDRKPDYKNIECCGLKSRWTQWVNFNTDCDMEDIMAVNFTAKALAGN